MRVCLCLRKVRYRPRHRLAAGVLISWRIMPGHNNGVDGGGGWQPVLHSALAIRYSLFSLSILDKT
jgi:hypothetical protein